MQQRTGARSLFARNPGVIKASPFLALKGEKKGKIKHAEASNLIKATTKFDVLEQRGLGNGKWKAAGPCHAFVVVNQQKLIKAVFVLPSP